eukprot:3299619-Prymnesium_polylepis.1
MNYVVRTFLLIFFQDIQSVLVVLHAGCCIPNGTAGVLSAERWQLLPPACGPPAPMSKPPIGSPSASRRPKRAVWVS